MRAIGHVYDISIPDSFMSDILVSDVLVSDVLVSDIPADTSDREWTQDSTAV